MLPKVLVWNVGMSLLSIPRTLWEMLPSLIYYFFLEETVWNWCYFFLECLVEFTSVAVWAERCLFCFVLFFSRRLLTTHSVSLIVVIVIF